ncbi:MAG TPA: helix-turn-helix domain-containing protein [Candidatus Tectomicrobia bacterium]
MRGPKPPLVALNSRERQELETLVRRRTTAQQIALRARILLAAAAGHNNSQIARQLGLEIDTVRFWRNRWLGLRATSLDDLSVADRLADGPRPGRPPTISPEQVCQIVSLGCEAPSQSGRPISQWSGREVADEIVKRGILAQISPRHAARLLKRGR